MAKDFNSKTEFLKKTFFFLPLECNLLNLEDFNYFILKVKYL